LNILSKISRIYANWKIKQRSIRLEFFDVPQAWIAALFSFSVLGGGKAKPMKELIIKRQYN